MKNILDLEITKPLINKDSIFYIGLGKTGSASIFHSFPNRPTFHYHNFHYFNYVNNGNLKNNQELYNLISNIGYMLGFKPYIIECLRNPYDRAISATFHKYFNDKKLDIDDLFKMDINVLKRIVKHYYDEKPIYQTVNIPDNIIHITLKLEEREKWNDILKSYGINDFVNKSSNVNKSKKYKDFKKLVKNNISFK